MNLVDFFGGTFVIFALAIVEMVLVVWYYGKSITQSRKVTTTKQHNS